MAIRDIQEGKKVDAKGSWWALQGCLNPRGRYASAGGDPPQYRICVKEKRFNKRVYPKPPAEGKLIDFSRIDGEDLIEWQRSVKDLLAFSMIKELLKVRPS